MLSRLFRFRGYTSLSYVYKRGQMVRGTQLSLKYIRNDRRNQFRAAVVVSRKVDKSAVVRNRIRRRVYEIVRQRAGRISGPYDLVFTVFSAQLATLPAPELEKTVLQLLDKAGVLTSAKAANHDIVD